MHNQNCAIILKKMFPRKQKTCLISPNFGKLYAVCSPKTLDFLWPGTFIELKIENTGNKISKIENVQRKSFLIGLDYIRIFKIYEFLNICEKLIPIGQPCTQSFWVIKESLEIDWQKINIDYLDLVIRSCLIELFNVLGLACPRETKNYRSIFQKAISIKVDPKILSILEFTPEILKKSSLHFSFIKQRIEAVLDKKIC